MLPDLVSIIVPYYNTDLALLKSAVDSSLSQTYSNIEIIICDDGSEHEIKLALKELVRSYKDKVYLVDHFENKGISCARNTAVRCSSGKWLVWLDADDLLDFDCIMRLIEASEDYTMVVGESYVHEKGSCAIRKPKMFYELAKSHLGTIYDPFLLNVISLQPQIVLRKSFVEVGGFNPAYCMAEMTEFFLCFLLYQGLNKIKFISNAIYHYNRHLPNTISSDRERLFRYRKQALDYYKTEQGINLDDIFYVGRSLNTGMQSYLPVKDGTLLIPDYFKYDIIQSDWRS